MADSSEWHVELFARNSLPHKHGASAHTRHTRPKTGLCCFTRVVRTWEFKVSFGHRVHLNEKLSVLYVATPYKIFIHVLNEWSKGIAILFSWNQFVCAYLRCSCHIFEQHLKASQWKRAEPRTPGCSCADHIKRTLAVCGVVARHRDCSSVLRISGFSKMIYLRKTEDTHRNALFSSTGVFED